MLSGTIDGTVFKSGDIELMLEIGLFDDRVSDTFGTDFLSHVGITGAVWGTMGILVGAVWAKLGIIGVVFSMGTALIVFVFKS